MKRTIEERLAAIEKRLKIKSEPQEIGLFWDQGDFCCSIGILKGETDNRFLDDNELRWDYFVPLIPEEIYRFKSLGVPLSSGEDE